MAAMVVFWLVTQSWQALPPGLAQEAARESLRRAALPPATIRLTDPDFPPGTPAAASARTVPASGDAMPQKDEAWWRARVKQLTEVMARTDATLESLSVELAGLERDIAARDDPAQRSQLVRRRAALVDERQERQRERRAQDASLEALLEEARKAGVPPGWLRDPAPPPSD